MATCSIALQKYDHAYSDLSEAIKVSQNAKYYMRLAHVAYKMGKKDVGERCIREAIARSGNNVHRFERIFMNSPHKHLVTPLAWELVYASRYTSVDPIVLAKARDIVDQAGVVLSTPDSEIGMDCSKSKRGSRILLTVVKNISVLDYALPLLWKIKRENPEADVSVLYYQISCWKVLRKDKFYSHVMRQCGIKQYDLSDFLYRPYGLLAVVWRHIFSRADRDISIFKKIRYPQIRKFARLAENVLKKTESFIINKIDVEKILPSINPNIILLDNRAHNLRMTLRGGNHLHKYLARERKKVVLLPHGAHHGKVDDFQPFDKQDWLPDYCEFWIPFRFDRNWEKIPEKRSQFFHVGYPGLDSEWLQWLKKEKSPKNTYRNRKGSLKALYITRKFLKKGEAKIALSEFTLTYDEFIHYLNLIASVVSHKSLDI